MGGREQLWNRYVSSAQYIKILKTCKLITKQYLKLVEMAEETTFHVKANSTHRVFAGPHNPSVSS